MNHLRTKNSAVMSARNKVDEYILESLEARSREHLLRKLPPANSLIDFCSNDYLGFSMHPALTKFNALNMPAGATGSRLISGNTDAAMESEQYIAGIHGAEASLIFNSGYMANLGLLSGVGDRHTVFIADELVHASLIDGMRLSLAKRVRFLHNDIHDLESKLASATEEKKFVVIESVYSMDGDLAPLTEIVALCEQYDAKLIVDEAHATGVFGRRGEGIVNMLELEKKVWARIHTFGKALGLHGAAVVGSKLLRDYLVNFARPFIYTTALPPHLYHQVREAYVLVSDTKERERLFENISIFKHGAEKASPAAISFKTNNSPIQSVIVPGNENTLAFSKHLADHGFYVKAILSPTVSKGSERVRICIHSFNTADQIDQLVSVIKNYFE